MAIMNFAAVQSDVDCSSFELVSQEGKIPRPQGGPQRYRGARQEPGARSGIRGQASKRLSVKAGGTGPKARMESSFDGRLDGLLHVPRSQPWFPACLIPGAGTRRSSLLPFQGVRFSISGPPSPPINSHLAPITTASSS